MLLSEAQRAVLKQILMENTLLKQKTGDVLVFSFGMAESTTKVGSSSTINIKMQSGVNLRSCRCWLWKNYKSSFTGTFKQVKAEVLERKTLQIFLKH
jgi:hypothetical protein